MLRCSILLFFSISFIFVLCFIFTLTSPTHNIWHCVATTKHQSFHLDSILKQFVGIILSFSALMPTGMFIFTLTRKMWSVSILTIHNPFPLLGTAANWYYFHCVLYDSFNFAMGLWMCATHYEWALFFFMIIICSYFISRFLVGFVLSAHVCATVSIRHKHVFN